ncbi:MAG TPA: MCE family protein [Acidimicrobiales bacterium]|nr:MCE family protein [Acidimicrobiales bacterium]
MSRRVLVNLVAFLGVFVLTLWWAVNNIISFEFLERPYQIQGEFAGTAGVSSASEVAYLGVHYGEVESAELVEDKVVITMNIDRGKQIPAGSKARIFRKSAVGEPYIDFQPPEDYDDGGPYIEAGDVLPLEQTSVPLEFSELLRSASRVLSAVDPEQTRTLVHELAVALNGRGEALRDLTVDSDALLQTFAEKAELLDSLSANSTRLTRTVTERRGALSSSLRDLAAVGESLRNVEPDTRVLLERGTELLSQTADLVGDIKQDLDCVLHDLDSVIDVASTEENLGHLVTTLERGPTAFEYVWLTRDEEPGGVWVRTFLLLDTVNPPEQYLPPKELPAVPEIPECASPLTPRGSSAEAASTPVEGQSSRGAVPIALAQSSAGTDRTPVGLAVVLVSSIALGLGARRRARR